MLKEQLQGEKRMKQKKSKKMKMILRRISFLMGMILLLGVLPVDAKAAQIDLEQKASITIKLPELETPKQGASFAICKIGEISGQSPLVFTHSASFANAGVDLNDLGTSAKQVEAALKLREHVPAQPLLEETLIAKQEEIKFESLGVGVYLVYQTAMADYANISPTIIFIPHKSAENSIAYDLTIELKGEMPVIPTPSVIPSVTPSVIPSETPTVTPSETPSVTPRATITPSGGGGKTPSKGASNGSKTDDSSPILGIALLSIASLSTVVVLLKKRKKHSIAQ